MERLTLYYKSRKQYDIIQTSDRHENEQREIMAMNKLAEYESTGLEPSEIEKLKHDLAVRDKALELAVKDKIKYENVLLEEFAGMGAKPALRKKEQYYLDQAEKELKGEK